MGYMNEYEYSINEAKEEIKNSVEIYLKKSSDGKYILPSDRKNPFYVVGLPGIGKTDMAKQIAEELGIGFYATSLTHHTRNSLLGLPVISSVGKCKSTEYTMPDILAQIEKRCEVGETEGILLIDEFASMSEALVAPMLAFLQNKSIGNHRLPEGWIMILCSNPPEYNETAREFDAAVMDRVRLINIAFSLKDFIKYAKTSGMHETIIDFIQQNPERAYRCGRIGSVLNGHGDSEQEREIVTARSWDNLSQCIYGYEKLGEDISIRLVYQFIKSRKLAEEFYRYYTLARAALNKSDFENIMAGRNIDDYVARVNSLSFDRKWQVVKLLRENLIQENTETYMDSRISDYLNSLYDRWTYIIPQKQRSDWYSSDMDCYEAIREIVHDVANEEMKEYYVPLDKDLKDLRRKILTELLQDIDGSLDVNLKGNKEIMKKLSKLIDRLKIQIDRRLSQNVKNIGNIIRFISELGDVTLKENLIREINKDSGILYTLAKRKCPEYTVAMGELLGESAQSFVS